MIHAKNYVKVESIQEAYELNQKKSSVIIGGMLWLKMSDMTKQTIIDLSGLELNHIEETEEEFRIGCMCSLHQLETDPALNKEFDGVFKECTRHIVGVQFRNCATIGGSVYGRYGFSDIITCLLTLETYVQLYHEGFVPLREYVERPRSIEDRDILVRVIIKKDTRKVVYHSQRLSSTDFPVIACGASKSDDRWYLSVGARPGRAKVVELTDQGIQNIPKMAKEAAESFVYRDNLRASAEYRKALAAIYLQRAMEQAVKLEECSKEEV